MIYPGLESLIKRALEEDIVIGILLPKASFLPTDIQGTVHKKSPGVVVEYR